jgi:hypothetical protein
MTEEKKCQHTIEDADMAWADGLCAYCLQEALAEQKAKFKELIDRRMKVSQRLKDAYLKHGQPTAKADYEIALWTEIQRCVDEAI